jgi:hypothetical protein
MTRFQDAGDPIEGRTKIVAVPPLSHAGVQRHAHPQRTDPFPPFGPQAMLGRHGGRQRRRRRAEDRAALVAKRLEDRTAVPLDRFA